MPSLFASHNTQLVVKMLKFHTAFLYKYTQIMNLTYKHSNGKNNPLAVTKLKKGWFVEINLLD